MTVVYVEDDPDIRESVTRPMKRRVGQLYVAADGREGLELVRKHRPQMVVTDLEMPVMDGMKMIRLLREEEEFRCPVLVVTAYDDTAHRTDYADRFIFKPVDLSELFRVMEEVAERCPA